MASSTLPIYDEAWLQHGREPQHFGRLSAATHRATGLNALCGDKVVIELEINQGVIDDYAFRAVGCTICIASGSLLGTACLHQPLAVVSTNVATNADAFDRENRADLSAPFATLTQVLDFPTRIKCATLALRTFLAASVAADVLVTTE